MSYAIQHTPGPWKIEQYADGYEILAPGVASVAFCKCLKENKHNAHLIASSPELLESIIGLMDLAHRYHEQLFGADSLPVEIIAAHDSINKALNAQP